ncbi:MAG: aspartate aminotransferase family protein, partial [Planctomycetia bacterium]|nr:aspartate aminotransferase family protein [Planctomycetia bacterium]
LQLLKDGQAYVRLEQLGARLEQGLRNAATSAGIDHAITRVGSMLTFFFHPGPVTNWTTASRSDTAKYAQYFWGLIDRGVYMPCSQYEALFISTAHTDEDIDATVNAAKEAFAAM